MRAGTGEFDPTRDPYTGIRATPSPATRTPGWPPGAAQAVDRAAARTPAVRCRWSTRRRAVAVIGHLGDRVLTDWYSGTLPYRVTIADGLRDRARPVFGDHSGRSSTGSASGTPRRPAGHHRAPAARCAVGDGPGAGVRAAGLGRQRAVPRAGAHAALRPRRTLRHVDDDGVLAADLRPPRTAGWSRSCGSCTLPDPDDSLLYSNAHGRYVTGGAPTGG